MELCAQGEGPFPALKLEPQLECLPFLSAFLGSMGAFIKVPQWSYCIDDIKFIQSSILIIYLWLFVGFGCMTCLAFFSSAPPEVSKNDFLHYQIFELLFLYFEFNFV